MKPFPLVLAAILIGIAASLIFFQQGPSELTGEDHQPEAPLARKQRPSSQPTSETLTIAEKVSRPSKTELPKSGSETSTAATADIEDEAVSEPLRRANEISKALRRESERLDEALGNHVVLQPAAWIDLGEDSQIPQEHQDGIQQIASELREKIAESGLDPSSPAYRKLWNDAVRESNWKFRARYGARAWSRHHIQAFHSSQAQANQD